METELLMLMLLGMGNGLLHALDADHISAVSSLAVAGTLSRRRIFRTVVMWSVGHGALLLGIVLSTMSLGIVVPHWLIKIAEISIGIILLAVGLGILLPFLRRTLRITSHRHPRQAVHIHLHDKDHGPLSDHRPVLVGMIHGVAGSAPLLAVLPAMFGGNHAAAGLYILLFSLSVGAAMCLFGGLFSGVSAIVSTRLARGQVYLQRLLGCQAMIFGGYWLFVSAT